MDNATSPQVGEPLGRFLPEPSRWERISRELLSWYAGGLSAPSWDDDDLRTAAMAGFVEGIGPYLDYLYRSSPQFERLPDGFRRALARQREGNRQRTARILSEVGRLFAALHDAGIPAIPLKGVAVGPLVYPAADLRPMADIDLLVVPAQLGAASQIVSGLGYEFSEQTWRHRAFTHTQTRQVVDFTAEHPDNPLRIEVHTRMAQFFWGLTCDLTARLWRKARPGSFVGAEAMLLPPAEMLLVVAVHASSHILAHNARIVHLLDVAHLAQAITEQNSWDDVLKGWGGSRLRFAYPALSLTAVLLPGSIPADVLARMKRQVPRRLVRWAAQGDVFFALSHFGSAHRQLTALDFMRRLPRHPLEVAQMGLGSLFPPRWYLAERFPHWGDSRWLSLGWLWVALGYVWLNAERLRSVGRGSMRRRPKETG